MPNTRVLLWAALAAILYLNYDAWMHDYQAPAAASTVGQSGAAPSGKAGTLGDSVPQAWNAAPPPNAPAPASAPAPAAATPSAQAAATPAVAGSFPAPPTAAPSGPATSSS